MRRNLRNWSKNRKIIIQLLGIATIYTIVWLPLAIISLYTIFSEHCSYVENIGNYLYFLTYLCEMTVPILVLFLMPEIVKKLCLRSRSNAINIASVSNGPCSTY